MPKTWDELLEVASKLTTDKRFGVLFDVSPGYYQNFTWYPFMWQGGGEFQAADGKSAFNSPASIQALKLWQDAVNAGAAPRQALAAAAGTWSRTSARATARCRTSASGRSRSFARARPT